ncbi:MAG: flagellar hook-length control protein FliK [Endozoicomonas sp. (ex Botrylloides leachii)]|nr:flagellar hook-length control protein FliK [Endozoicomonas sp. (ex Botrylloides leachii)]
MEAALIPTTLKIPALHDSSGADLSVINTINSYQSLFSDIFSSHFSEQNLLAHEYIHTQAKSSADDIAHSVWSSDSALTLTPEDVQQSITAPFFEFSPLQSAIRDNQSTINQWSEMRPKWGQLIIDQQRAGEKVIQQDQVKQLSTPLNVNINTLQPTEINSTTDKPVPSQIENSIHTLGFYIENNSSPTESKPFESRPSLQTEPTVSPLKSHIENSIEVTQTKQTSELAKPAHSEIINRATLANPAPKLGQRILHMVSKGESSIELRLDPPELGRLTLSLSVDKENLNLQITTSNAAVRDLLLNHDARLRQTLAEQGLSLGDIGVNVQSEQQGHHQQATSADIDTLGVGVLADGTEVDQSFIPSALQFMAQGGRLLDQFI